MVMPAHGLECLVAKRKTQAAPLRALTDRIASVDARSIDELYGLEPVYEPGAPPGGRLMPEEFVSVQCPYCGERFETRIDLTTNDPGYVEDCQVCCRPIEIGIERDPGGALLAVKVQRMD
jgi:hypothetical protein